ncbi:expressed unknown protein [Seminavis robusta]|uniref:Uncharacterized protein n=1 Tax=Seminavis robusta TaxID=568900 RepID=A0A9N8DDN0_9STRA|nr:expressed unknown protein [Seminavis robusta]|eukprot:Sro90_g047410.1 n/a (458) ;mRNA; f:80744-82311
MNFLFKTKKTVSRGLAASGDGAVFVAKGAVNKTKKGAKTVTRGIAAGGDGAVNVAKKGAGVSLHVAKKGAGASLHVAKKGAKTISKGKNAVSEGLSEDNLVNMADHMLFGVEKLENLVVGRTSSHGSATRRARGRGRGSGGKGRKNDLRASRSEQNQMMVYCSDMYSEDFVLAEVKKAGKNSLVTHLVLEDLIARDQDSLTDAVKEFLIGTVPCADKRIIRLDRGSGMVRRPWEGIVFTDCISDAEDYKNYQEKKNKFLSGLSRLLTAKQMSVTMPLHFVAKLEIHSMLNAVSIAELLQEVERDRSIKLVRIPGFQGTDDEIAAEFASFLDTDSMEWKGPLVEIRLQYDKEGITMDEILAKKSGKKAKDTIRAIMKAFEQACYADELGSLADEDDEGSVASLPHMDGAGVNNKRSSRERSGKRSNRGMRDESTTERSSFSESDGENDIIEVRRFVLP